jgi:hypothetical protein
MLTKLLQYANARAPIDLAEEGMLTLVKLSHPANAFFPIDLTDDGMVMPVKLLQFWNA